MPSFESGAGGVTVRAVGFPGACARPETTRSSVESEGDRALDGLIGYLDAQRTRIGVRAIARMASCALGDRCVVGDASRYIYEYARSLGYDIPPYPLAGCGEIKEFFRDEGVANVPEWYARLGIEGEEYATLHERTIVAVRGSRGTRTVFVIDGVRYVQDKGFVPIDESGIAGKLADPDLARLIAAVFEAALVDER